MFRLRSDDTRVSLAVTQLGPDLSLESSSFFPRSPSRHVSQNFHISESNNTENISALNHPGNLPFYFTSNSSTFLHFIPGNPRKYKSAQLIIDCPAAALPQIQEQLESLLLDKANPESKHIPTVHPLLSPLVSSSTLSNQTKANPFENSIEQDMDYLDFLKNEVVFLNNSEDDPSRSPFSVNRTDMASIPILAYFQHLKKGTVQRETFELEKSKRKRKKDKKKKVLSRQMPQTPPPPPIMAPIVRLSTPDRVTVSPFDTIALQSNPIIQKSPSCAIPLVPPPVVTKSGPENVTSCFPLKPQTNDSAAIPVPSIKAEVIPRTEHANASAESTIKQVCSQDVRLKVSSNKDVQPPTLSKKAPSEHVSSKKRKNEKKSRNGSKYAPAKSLSELPASQSTPASNVERKITSSPPSKSTIHTNSGHKASLTDNTGENFQNSAAISDKKIVATTAVAPVVAPSAVHPGEGASEETMSQRAQRLANEIMMRKKLQKSGRKS